MGVVSVCFIHMACLIYSMLAFSLDNFCISYLQARACCHAIWRMSTVAMVLFGANCIFLCACANIFCSRKLLSESTAYSVHFTWKLDIFVVMQNNR